MTMISFAKEELRRANFAADESAAIIEILEIFYDAFDSGGAVAVVAPVLQRLIACQPLTPLSGADDEWNEVGHGVWQNRRDFSVFKERRGDDVICYDIDTPGRPAISFPYLPTDARVPSPVMQIG